MATEYTFKGELTFEEYLECHKLLAAQRRLTLRIIITLCGTGMLLSSLLSPGGPNDKAITLYGVLFLLYGLVISPIQFRMRIRRYWKNYPAVRKPFHVTLKPDGLQTLDDKGNPTHRDWSTFIHYRETNTCLLLYLSPRQPLILPKRLTPETNLPAITQLLDNKLGKKQTPPAP